MNAIGIGLIGYGMIGRVHALAFRDLPIFYPGALPPIHLAAVCTSRPETARQAAAEAGFAGWCTGVEALLARDDVTVVDCAVPNYLHRELLLAAIRAGKDVIVEKPLAMNASEAEEIVAAARRAGVRAGMIFNYRFVPALMRARQLIAEGFVGPVYHFRAEYLHGGYQNPDRPMSWKLRRSQAGGGALTDLGAHVIDLVRTLLGEFEEVRATTRTYVAERPAALGSGEREPVDVEDAAWVQVRLASGAMGTLETSRFATGALDDLRIEVHGERGALRFNLMDGNWLYAYDQTAADEPAGGRRGWTRVETLARYPGAVSPPSRAILGWGRTHAENLYAVLKALAAGQEPEPGLLDGLRVHQVLDAAYASAAAGTWTRVRT
jgi:predicted dehydrogenase